MQSFGGIISAGASLLGGAVASQSAKEAAKIQARGYTDAMQMQIDAQNKMLDKQMMAISPYLESGKAALSDLNTGLVEGGKFTKQFKVSDIEDDPGYQFDLAQGLQAVQRSAAAKGSLSSGGTLKSIASFTKGLASEEVNSAFNRFMTQQDAQFNRLSTIASLGSGAVNTLSNFSQNYANQVSNAYGAGITGAAGSTASGVVGSANAISGGVTNAANNYTQYATLDKLLKSMETGNSNLTNLKAKTNENIGG